MSGIKYDATKQASKTNMAHTQWQSLFLCRNHLVGPYSFQIKNKMYRADIALLFLLVQYLVNISVLSEDHTKMKIWIQYDRCGA